jgi:hypothetical protein
LKIDGARKTNAVIQKLSGVRLFRNVVHPWFVKPVIGMSAEKESYYRKDNNCHQQISHARIPPSK